MGENSKIEWTDHTFNPWMGCTKVSPACDGCYAEAMMDHRYGKVKWGPHGDRVRTAPSNWKQPLRWDKEAKAAGTRPRVFCASLADVFDNQVPSEWRRDLFALMRATSNLTWLLLTKRPQNIVKLFREQQSIDGGAEYIASLWPRNAAIGTTVEDQQRADVNVTWLLDAKALLRPAFAFLSCEPLLGPIDLTRIVYPKFRQRNENDPYVAHDTLRGHMIGPDEVAEKLDWVIAGGETDQGQHKARPSDPEWFRMLRDQCAAAGTAFHFKQWGSTIPDAEREGRYRRVPKSVAGRLLDGIEHNGFPEVSA